MRRPAVSTVNDEARPAIGSGPAAHIAPAPVRAPSIGAELVQITSEFKWTPTLYRAFVKTGSESNITLCSVKDAVDPGNIQLATCGEREFNGERGLILSVFFFREPTPEEFVEMVAYQQGAEPFGPPVFAPIE